MFAIACSRLSVSGGLKKRAGDEWGLVGKKERSNPLQCGFIAQLVQHRTGIAEVTGSNPVEALIFFRLLLSNCLNWKICCDDHTSL